MEGGKGTAHFSQWLAYLKKSSDSCLQLLSSFRGRVLDDVVTCCPAGQPNAGVICACVTIHSDLHSKRQLMFCLTNSNAVIMYVKLGTCPNFPKSNFLCGVCSSTLRALPQMQILFKRCKDLSDPDVPTSGASHRLLA